MNSQKLRLLNTAELSVDTPQEKVKTWVSNEIPFSYSMFPFQQPHHGIGQTISFHKDAFLGVPAYAWLRARLQRETDIEVEAASVMKQVADKVVEDISHVRSTSGQIKDVNTSPNSLEGLYSVDFLLDWNPLDFYKEQGYTESPMEALDRAITLTSSHGNVQALMTSQYLSQIWSFTGEGVLEALKKSFTSSDGKGDIETLRDGTKIRIKPQVYDAQLHVRVNGSIDAVVEIAEALAWLGAALQSSPRKQGVVECCPVIRTAKMKGHPGKKDQLDPGFSIDFRFESIDSVPIDQASPGQCWHGALQNPVVVRGYPVPFRTQEETKTGLEIPLSIMGTLVGSHRISRFNGGLYIKSFSSILILMRKTGTLLIWHLVFNEDGEYLSYSDPKVHEVTPLAANSVSTADLENARHVLGWCEKVTSHVGGPMANYSIDWSGLPKPHSKCAFDKASISGGYFISASVSATLGKKDKPVYIKSRDDYTTRLKWMEKKYVVLYDLEDRRAWLSDGVSTLLHLVRASLEQDSQDSFKELFRYNPEQLQEAGSKTGKAAAIAVLTNHENQELELYQKPDSNSAETTIKQTGEIEKVSKRTKTFFRFKDRVDQIYHLLEQIIAYQSQLDSEDGVGFRIKFTPRRQLEGFDFMDVASDEDPFWPRVTTLKATGAGWVDFAGAIHAITLFSIGFGDLMKPHDNEQVCLNWTEVPKGLDYLAVCASDLKEILKKRGNIRENPWRVVDDIYWHVPDKLFDECDCSPKASGKGCDRAQILLPAKFPKTWGRSLASPSKLESSGAVIIGHSRKFPLRWADQVDCPTLGEPSLEDDLVDAFQDSGLGESIGGSTVSGSSGAHGSSESSKGKQKKGLFDSFDFSKRKRSKSPGNQAPQ